MKVTKCDSCGADNARSYKYLPNGGRKHAYTDLCVNCVQDFVLKNQTKLTEVQDSIGPAKKVIHG